YRDWSSDVCSSDLLLQRAVRHASRALVKNERGRDGLAARELRLEERLERRVLAERKLAALAALRGRGVEAHDLRAPVDVPPCERERLADSPTREVKESRNRRSPLGQLGGHRLERVPLEESLPCVTRVRRLGHWDLVVRQQPRLDGESERAPEARQLEVHRAAGVAREP